MQTSMIRLGVWAAVFSHADTQRERRNGNEANLALPVSLIVILRRRWGTRSVLAISSMSRLIARAFERQTMKTTYPLENSTAARSSIVPRLVLLRI
jgi:hypothetical protein